MKKITILFFLLLSITITSCKSDKKESSSFDLTETLNEKEVVHKKIVQFFNNNVNVDEASYSKLYDLIKKDYLLNRDNNKYQMLINIAKKTFKEKNVSLKNEMYKNFKNEFLKKK